MVRVPEANPPIMGLAGPDALEAGGTRCAEGWFTDEQVAGAFTNYEARRRGGELPRMHSTSQQALSSTG